MPIVNAKGLQNADGYACSYVPDVYTILVEPFFDTFIEISESKTSLAKDAETVRFSKKEIAAQFKQQGLIHIGWGFTVCKP